jgi:hypothetical protein
MHLQFFKFYIATFEVAVEKGSMKTLKINFINISS